MQLSDDVAAVRLDAVSKVYNRGAGTVQALRDVSVSVPHRTFIAVMGLRSARARSCTSPRGWTAPPKVGYRSEQRSSPG